MKNETQQLRETPRERGKTAYRAKQSSVENPYPAKNPDWISWAEGWIWQSIHFPRHEDQQKISPWEIDPDCKMSDVDDWKSKPE